MTAVYLSLGSNLGHRRLTIWRAIRLIESQIGTVVRRSSFHETKPWGFQSVHPFINAAVCVETTMTPRQLLEKTQQIERELGRKTKSSKGVYHDRPIDIDILLYGDRVVDEDDLKIPHPLMYEREFVMLPLQEILEH